MAHASHFSLNDSKYIASILLEPFETYLPNFPRVISKSTSALNSPIQYFCFSNSSLHLSILHPNLLSLSASLMCASVTLQLGEMWFSGLSRISNSLEFEGLSMRWPASMSSSDAGFNAARLTKLHRPCDSTTASPSSI
ncbi:hypothetical protein AB237_1055 [Acinetobacter baumannii NCGM 237]|nr:hypothetical protein AB237_1055 [Acinetobacter baumannii NCGM 237]